MPLARPVGLDSLALPIPVPLELTSRAGESLSVPALRRRALDRLTMPLPLGLYKGRAGSVLMWDLDALHLVDISRWLFSLAAGWVTLVGALVWLEVLQG